MIEKCVVLLPSCGATPCLISAEIPALSGFIVSRIFAAYRLVDQLSDRNADKIRIAQQTASIGEGVAHRLYFVMQRLRRSPTQLVELIPLQNVQYLADGNAARARRRCRDQMIGPVIALDGCELTGRVAIQIVLIDDFAACPAGLHDGRPLCCPCRIRRRPGLLIERKVPARSRCTSLWPVTKGCPSLRKISPVAENLLKSSIAVASMSMSP